MTPGGPRTGSSLLAALGAVDLAGVTLGILDHLGLTLPADRTVTPVHRRQADDLNRAWTTRYRSGERTG